MSKWPEREGCIRVFNIEKAIRPGGKNEMHVGFQASSDETAQAFYQHIRHSLEESGAEIGESRLETKEDWEQDKGKGNPQRSFGITNWKNCLWNPEGPKPNWVQPKDPSKN